ncbi:MAG: DMT family transporter [Janthinobacterium lividum]
MSSLPFIISLVFYVAVAAGIRKIAGHFDMAFIINMRYVFQLFSAAAITIAIGLKTSGKWTALLESKNWKIQASRSVTAFGGTTSFLFTGYFLPISISNSLALAFRPIIILLFGRIPIFREKIYKKGWILASIITTMAGVAVMLIANKAGPFHTNHDSANLRNMILGPVVILINETFTTLGYHLNRAAAKSGESKWTTLTFSAMFGAILSTIIIWGFPGSASRSSFTMGSVDTAMWGWLGVVVFISTGAQLLQQVSAGKLPTSTLSYLAVLQPVIGGIFDFLFFHLIPSPLMFLAMTILVAASFLGMPSLLEAKKQNALRNPPNSA